MIFTILSLAKQTNWKNSKAFLITHDGLLLGCRQLSHNFLHSHFFLDPEALAQWAQKNSLRGNFWLGRGSQPKENKITDNYAWFTRATQIQKETRGDTGVNYTDANASASAEARNGNVFRFLSLHNSRVWSGKTQTQAKKNKAKQTKKHRFH